MDADHVGDLPATVLAARAGQARAAAMAQAGHELPAQLPSRLGVDGRGDTLVGDVAFRFVGKHTLEGSRYLLRRPLPFEHCAHHTPAHTAEVELGERTKGYAPGDAGLLGRVRAVTPLGVACQKIPNSASKSLLTTSCCDNPKREIVDIVDTSYVWKLS